MKLLFDQNLSHRLATMIADLFPMSLHVREVGLKEASDTIIWEYAKDHDFMIITKDADFHQRSFLLGHPPKVVWVRRGNCSTKLVEEIIRTHYASILQFYADERGAFLVLE